MGAGTKLLAAEFAIQHRPARADDGRYVTARSPHQEGRGGLVAAGHQNDAVDRIAADRFLDIHRGEIAEQHRCWPKIALAGRKHRKFHRKAAGLIDAVLHALGEVAKMGVTRGKFGPGVADADHRPAVEEIVGKALIFHPATMQETVPIGMPEPGGTA